MPRIKSFNNRKKAKRSCSLEKQKIEKSIPLNHSYFQSQDDPKSSYSRTDVEVVEMDPEPKIEELSRNKEENSHPGLHEFSFISQEEYDSINSHELYIEKVNPVPTLISGHRIVDLQYVLSWALRLQGEHSKLCTLSRLEVVDEVCAGLTSLIVFQCVACGHRIEKSTENPDNDKSDINYGAVWGTLSTGSTYQHLKDFLGIMDIPCMSYRCFHSIEIELGDQWKFSLWMSMERAGKEEKRLAIESGQVDSDGLPWTIVYCDGGWSHRSYGHSYNASSGVAVIIGKLTKKILFLGVRNKYCSVCSRYDHKQKTPPNHICYKNWNGSSGAMEASIIAKGFQQSISMHGLKYLQFVADGDSSVYSKIRSEVSYGADVTKIECRNHAIKNYGKALYKIKSDTTLNIEARKLLTTTIIKQLQDICTKIIYINACGDVEKLKINLENSISHVFEDHSNCDESYCTEVRVKKNETMKNVQSTGLFYHLNSESY